MSGKDFKVIAIGGGPAGIATGIEGISFGLKSDDVLVLEKGEAPAEAIKKFYPDKKMTLANYKGLPTETHGHLPSFPDLTKAETLKYFDDLIQKYHLKMALKSEVYKVVPDPKGGDFRVLVGREEYRAAVVTIGIGILGRPNKPSYKLPNSLRDHLLFDITSQKIEGQNVLIVGGGDTSSEYAQVLVQDGNRVSLVIRAKDLSRMMEANQKALLGLVDQKKATYHLGLEVSAVEDRDGKPFVSFSDPNQLASATFDKVIFAIGGTTPVNFLRTAGVNCENNWPVVSETGLTNIPRLYLTGDLVAGKTGGSIISAYNSVFRSVSEFVSELK